MYVQDINNKWSIKAYLLSLIKVIKICIRWNENSII